MCPVGEPSSYILCPSDSTPSFLNFPLLLTWQGEPGSFILSFRSLGTHHLVDKRVHKLGSGDWCNYCHWNVAVSSNLGINVCTQSHTQTHRHTSIVTYQSSHICTPIEYKKFAWRPLIPVEFLRFVLVSFLSILEIPFSKNDRCGSQYSCVFAELMNPSAYKWSLLHERVLLTIYAEPSLVLDFHTSLNLESMKQLASLELLGQSQRKWILNTLNTHWKDWC